MEVIFKKSDNVYHIQYGWGVVTDIIDHDGLKYVQCNFPFGHKHISFAINNKLKNLLSFTEYKLEGFCDKRPEELPQKGQIVWGRSQFFKEWQIGHFFEKRGNKYLLSSHPNPNALFDTVDEITTENPYKNEK